MCVTITSLTRIEYRPYPYLRINHLRRVFPPSCRCRDCGYVSPIDDFVFLHGLDPICIDCIPFGTVIDASFVWGDWCD